MCCVKEGHSKRAELRQGGSGPDKDRSGPNPSLNPDLDPVRDSGDFQNLIWTSQSKDIFLVNLHEDPISKVANMLTDTDRQRDKRQVKITSF